MCAKNPKFFEIFRSAIKTRKIVTADYRFFLKLCQNGPAANCSAGYWARMQKRLTPAPAKLIVSKL